MFCLCTNLSTHPWTAQKYLPCLSTFQSVTTVGYCIWIPSLQHCDQNNPVASPLLNWPLHKFKTCFCNIWRIEIATVTCNVAHVIDIKLWEWYCSVWSLCRCCELRAATLKTEMCHELIAHYHTKICTYFANDVHIWPNWNKILYCRIFQSLGNFSLVWMLKYWIDNMVPISVVAKDILHVTIYPGLFQFTLQAIWQPGCISMDQLSDVTHSVHTVHVCSVTNAPNTVIVFYKPECITDERPTEALHCVHTMQTIVVTIILTTVPPFHHQD